MGRVTVFTDDDCGSRMIMKQLDENYIPFHEISLTKHPGRRSDMITLTNSVTTPQVFFNTKYIGGYQMTKNLLERYKQESKFSGYSSLKERMTIEVLDMPMQDIDQLRLPPTEASDDSFEVMEKEYKKWRQNLDRYDELMLLNSEKTSVTQVTRDFNARFSSQVAVKTTRRKIYGGEILSFLMEKYGLNTVQATMFAEKLVGLGVIHNISKYTRSKGFVKKGYYSLKQNQTTHTVNGFRIWSKNLNIKNFTPDPTPFLTVSKLLKSLSMIVESAMNCQGGIDYERAKATPGYKYFQEEVAYLQLVNLRMDHYSKMAFFINIYNIMVAHFSLEFNTRKMTSEIFCKFNYNIGGYLLSLDDIYHGILRGNANHPISGKQVFTKNDARSHLTLSSLDPRIHFALNNTGYSLFSYEFHCECIEQELDVVTKRICTTDKSIVVDDRISMLTLPAFFKTYLCDFVKENEASGLANVLLNHLEGEKYKQLKEIVRRRVSSKNKVRVQFRKKYETGKVVKFLCAFSPWKSFLKSSRKKYVKTRKLKLSSGGIERNQNNSNSRRLLTSTVGAYQYSFMEESNRTNISKYKFSDRMSSFMSSESSIISRVRRRMPSFDVFRVDTNILSDSGSEWENQNNIGEFPRTPTRIKVITKEESFSRTPMTSTETPDSYSDKEVMQTGNKNRVTDSNSNDPDEVSKPEISKPPDSRRLDFNIELMDELFPSCKDLELFPEDADYSQFEGSFTESDLVSNNGSALGRSDYSRSEITNFTDDDAFFITKSLPIQRTISVASF